MSKKTAFFLFSVAHPGGFQFNETSEKRQELVDSDEWYEHPNEVPKHEDGPRTGSMSTNADNAQQANAEPRYSLSELLASNASFFSVGQIVGEAAKHKLVLASVDEAGALTLVKGADEPRQFQAPKPTGTSAVSYDNEAVAAMILRGNTDPLNHQHFVALAKVLGVKTHKVRQEQLIANLKAAIEGAQPPQQNGGGSDGDGDDDEVEENDETGNGSGVASLQPQLPK